MRTNREAKDAQRIARAVLATPLSEGPVVDPEDALSISELSSSNLDLFTRALIAHGMKAANGDVKSMELMMKLAGYESKQDLNVTLTIPTYIDDVTTIDVTPQPEVIEQVTDAPILEAPADYTIVPEPPVLKCIENGMVFASIAEAARVAETPYSKFRAAIVKGKAVNGLHYVRV